MADRDPVIRLDSVSKHFGGVQALKEVSFDIMGGEVHAIVGENGAGKSTLMNILAGIYRADNGSIVLRGEEVHFRDPRDGQRNRISIVFQELSLFPDLTVAGNIFAGRELHGTSVFLDEKEMFRRAQAVLQEMGVDIPPGAAVGGLTLGQRQLVEIARALAQDSDIVIMDEPNSALTAKETDALFAIIRRLRGKGLTILYISHRLEEVFSIADRISVLHDGHYVGTWPVAETTLARVVHAMTGGIVVKPVTVSRSVQAGEPLLRVSGLSTSPCLQSIDFAAYGGEILGLAGLEGSGVNDVFRVLFGLDHRTQGEIWLQGRTCEIRSPGDAIDLGIAYVPASRREEGLMMDWSIRDNAGLVVLNEMVRGGVLDGRRIDALVRQYVSQLSIVTDSLGKHVTDLSGGNQQKVVISKWLATQPGLLMLNDPARGIDVGAKAEIFALVRALAEQGKTIMMTSSDVSEIVDICDRVLVFYRGNICAEYRRGEATKQRVMETMMKGTCEADTPPVPAGA